MNHNVINYYCEFSEPEKALDNIKNMYQGALGYIMNTYNLEELSNDNWKEYYNAVQKDSNVIYLNDYLNLKTFFDTYENTEKNDLISEKIYEYTKNSSISTLKDLDAILPDYSKKLLQNDYNITPFANQIFNVSAGVSYAEKYAWSPNSTKYGYLDPDDTNFASQILENGGYNHSSHQIYGWWYNSLSGYLIDCGDAWRYPNSFVNYFGTKNGYQRNFQIFSQNVERGDFIAIDIAVMEVMIELGL